jgi:hypothetical protein
MQLKVRRSTRFQEYRCDLTNYLDSLAGLSEQTSYNLFYHYILADDHCRKEKCLAIRVPGGTVGGIWIDDNNTITKIEIDTDYVVKSYPDNVNELVQKYIGEIVEYE